MVRVVCSIILMLSVTLVTAAPSTDAERRLALARFSEAAGKPSQALAWLQGLSSPTANLVRAKALLASGRTEQARQLLEALTQGDRHRGEAWLLLAREQLAQQRREAARPALQNAARLSHGATRQEALYHLADDYRQQGQLDQAGRVLAGMDDGYWAAMGYHNIATDYSDVDSTSARSLVAIRVALAMLDGDGNRRRAEALRAELLLKAGFLAYQSNEFQKATGFLDDVPLNSFATPKALYLHGLATFAQRHYRGAMQSWHRARKFPLAFSGSVDAWLGMGRSYDELGYLAQAGEAYLAANAALESEQVTLSTLADEVDNKGAYQAMVLAARNSDVEWFLADSRTLTQPRLAYLLHLAKQPDAQQAIARLATLADLAQALQRHDHDLSLFIETLDECQQTAANNRAVEQLAARATGLAGTLANLQSDEGQTSRTELATMTAQLSDIRDSLDRWQDRNTLARTQQTRLRDRARTLKTTIPGLLTAVTELQEAAGQELDRIATDFIEGERRRIRLAQDRAEQHIAYLYEYLALNTLERDLQREVAE